MVSGLSWVGRCKVWRWVVMGSRKGIPNKRSTMVLPMLEALGHRDPAIILAEIASMPELRLRKMLRTEAGRQAMAFRVKAASELMPYVHSKMAVKVDVGGDLPVFNIFGNRNQLEDNQGVSGPVLEHVGRTEVGQTSDLFEKVQQVVDKADD